MSYLDHYPNLYFYDTRATDICSHFYYGIVQTFSIQNVKNNFLKSLREITSFTTLLHPTKLNQLTLSIEQQFLGWDPWIPWRLWSISKGFV